MSHAIKSHARLIACASLLGLGLLVFHGLVGTPEGESYKFNLPWFDAFRSAFWAGDVYPRFLPELWYGLGAYDFFFYGPLPFWFSALIGEASCPGCDSGTVLSLGGAWMIIASGITFFLFARRFFAPAWAGFGAMLYAVLPYHYLIDWFDRQAIGEVAALMILPLLALATTKLIEDKKGGVLFAVSVAALALSHLPTTLIFVHLLAAIMVWVLLQTKGWAMRAELALRFTVWGLLGISLAAFYWVPALGLLHTVSPEMLATDFYNPMAWLFLDGQPEISPERSLIMKWGLALAVGSALGSLFILKRTSSPGALTLWIAGPSLFAFFLMTVFSIMIWEHWILNRVQFPWRALAVADLSIALSAIVITKHALETRKDAKAWRGRLTAAAAGFLLLGTAATQMPNVTDTVARGNALAGAHKPIGTPEYVPPGFLSPALTRFRSSVTDQDIGEARYDLFFAEMQRSVEAARAALQADAPGAVMSAHPHDRVSLTVTLEEARTIRLPLANWPHWRAQTQDGRPLFVGADAEQGLVTVALPQGRSEIELFLAEAPPQRLGSMLSLVALFGLLGGGVFCRIRRKFSADKPLATSLG